MNGLGCAIRRRLPVSREDGFTLVEVIVAVTLLALATTSFAVTSGNGFRLIGKSQERQTATQIANQWMEEARVVPLAGLALPTDTVFEDAATPDADVGGGGTTYTSEAGTETLVFAADSTFVHHEHENVNNVDFGVYRYVTWVPDGAITEAYKRVTVVVQWAAHGGGGTAESVTISSLMTTEGIAWSGTTSTTSSSSTTTTSTSSTTTTTAAPVCADDFTAPSATLSILAGSGAESGYTSSSTVTLSMTASDPCTPITMAFSNDGSTFSAAEPFASSEVWSLTAGDGTRTMWARFSDANGNSATHQASVIVDGTDPTTPGSFTATVKTGPKRVELTWTQSTDNQGVLGYRIYRKHGAGSYVNQSTGVDHPCPTTPCTWTDNSVQNNNTYTYYVVAYDAAGNESAWTAELTRTI